MSEVDKRSKMMTKVRDVMKYKTMHSHRCLETKRYQQSNHETDQCYLALNVTQSEKVETIVLCQRL